MAEDSSSANLMAVEAISERLVEVSACAEQLDASLCASTLHEAAPAAPAPVSALAAADSAARAAADNAHAAPGSHRSPAAETEEQERHLPPHPHPQLEWQDGTETAMVEPPPASPSPPLPPPPSPPPSPLPSPPPPPLPLSAASGGRVLERRSGDHDEEEEEDEFVTASECTCTATSRSASYHTASECGQSPWWDGDASAAADADAFPPPPSPSPPPPPREPRVLHKITEMKREIRTEVTETTNMRLSYDPPGDMEFDTFQRNLEATKARIQASSLEGMCTGESSDVTAGGVEPLRNGDHGHEDSSIECESDDALISQLKESREWLQLKVLEAQPELTQLGSTLAEALALQRQHEEVLQQLQSKQSPVEELLRQADQLISTQRPRAEVYAAMAESLGVAWKDVNSHLELKKNILELNVRYQSRAEECIERMLALEMACRDTNVPVEIEAVKNVLARLHDLKRMMLEALMVTLQDGRALHEKMKEVAAQGTLDSRPDRITTAANYTVSQIEHWLEDLHDRRKLLEVKWQNRKTQLEQCLSLALLAKDLKELDETLAIRKETLQRTNDQLGDSSASAELLLHEHKKLNPEAREFQDRCLKITKATEKLMASGHFAGEEATAQSYVVLNSCAEYLDSLEQREAMLNRSIAFFRSAHTALTKLDQLEIQLTTTDLSLSNPNLVQLHSQATKALEEITAHPLQEGYSLLETVGQSAPGAEGVKRTVQEIENRKISLDSLCTAHKEENIHLSRALTTFLERQNELYSWLVSIAEAFLQGHQDMGSVLAMAEDFLQLHQQLLSDLQNKGVEINDVLLTLPPILERLNDDQRTDIDEKVDALHSHWLTLKNILEARIDLATLYVRFHSIAVELANEFDAIEAEFKKGADSGEQETMRHVEQKWLHIQQLYGQLSNLGKSFIEDCAKSGDPYLDVKRASLCVETLLEHFGSRQLVITESWQTWQTNITVEREFKVLWERNMAESNRTMDWVSKLDAQLYPVLTGESSTSKIIVKELEEKLQVVLPELKKAQTEIELRVKTAENLATKGDSQGQKEAIIAKLVEQHNKINNTATDYQILLQMLISFLKNLSELEKTIENLQSQYHVTRLPNVSSEVDLLIKEHEASKQAVLELFKFTQNESEQIIIRINQQEPEKAARHDVERVSRLLEIKKLAWESAWTDRKLLLEQHYQLCQFDSDLQQINSTLSDLSKQLNSIRGQYGESLTSAKATSVAFVYFEKTIQLLETRIETFVSTAEHMLKSDHASMHVERELNQLQAKWSAFRNQVKESRRLIDLSIEHFILIEEAEEWFREGSKLLVSIARKSTAVKQPQEAVQLLNEVENFLKCGEIRQQERIKKISKLSIELYGGERSKQVTVVENENQEMIDSFTIISEELRILVQNLISADKQRERQKKEMEEADAILATAKAEAAAAKAAATAAEEAKRAAEAAAKVLQESVPVIEKVDVMVETTAIPIPPEPVKEIESARKTPSPPHKKAKVSEEIPRPSAPMFIVPLHDATIQEGEQFTFECRVTGFPMPEVIWYKDGISIQNNPDYQTTFDQGICTLAIEETFTEDSARFTCKAANAAGSAETNATLSVKEAEPEEQLSPSVFIRRIENGTAKEGSSYQLMCTVEGNPLPTVQWFKNDLCIDNSPDYVITYNNGEAILKFEEVFLEDQAEYSCKASNPLGTDVCNAKLTVEPLEPTEPPTFITPLSNVMARAGRKIKLECEVTGLPVPELAWTHNTKPIKETRDIKLQCENGKGTLIINEAFPKDAGTYIVVAKNIAGEASCSCNVCVKGRLPTETSDSEIASDLEPIKPSIQLALKDVCVLEGKQVRLDCIIVGQPEPEVIWYHNKRPVKESSDFQLLFQGDRCSLVIHEAYLEDAGEYKVVAINSGGEASSKCDLTVKSLGETEPATRPQVGEVLEMPLGSPPKFNKLLTDVLAPEGDKVVFECIVVGDPKPDIKWFLNNQEITDVSSKQFNEDAEGNVSLTLLKVSPQDRGVYTIRASNSNGEAKCFANLIVKTMASQETQTRVHMEDKHIAPSFKELFADRTVPECTSTKFECIVSGKPTPKIRWSFNNEPVSGKDFLISTSGERQVLSIQNVQKIHAGEVACTAENDAGKATCTARLSVVEPENSLDSSLSFEAANTSENTESSSFIMKRSVFMQSSSQTSSSTTVIGGIEPSVQKHSVLSQSEQSFQQIGQKPPIQVQSHKFKEIHQVNNESSDVEQQSFMKVSSGGEDTQDSSASCYSTPISSPRPVRKSIAPRFVSPLNGKIVDQGADVILEGIIDGYPQPTITWTKNGQELHSVDGKLSIKYDHNLVEVMLKDATVKDAGRYTCKAVNSVGSASSTADVVVKKTIFPPVFGRRLQALSIKEGERVVMEVEITGTPDPAVTWHKDGQLILGAVPGQPFRTKIQGNCYSLIIEKATIDYTGQYTVKAVNCGGEAQSIADVVVYKPEPHTESLIFEVLGESKVEKLSQPQTPVSKAATGLQPTSVTSVKALSPTPPVSELQSNILDSSYVSESRIITETTKTEKHMSIKLERSPSPVHFKPVTAQEFPKEHTVPVQIEKKEQQPAPPAPSPEPKIRIQTQEQVSTSFPTTFSKETEIKVDIKENEMAKEKIIPIKVEEKSQVTSSIQKINKETHIETEEKQRSSYMVQDTVKEAPKEIEIPVKIETLAPQIKSMSPVLIQPDVVEVTIEVKDQKPESVISVPKSLDILEGKESVIETVKGTEESGVETGSVSKKTAYEFFVNKMKESEENLKSLKEPIKLPTQETVKTFITSSPPDIQQQSFTKTEVRNGIPRKEGQSSFSESITSQFHSEHSSSVKFEKQVIHHQHQLSADSLLEEFNLQPEPPPEMGFIPKSEVTGKYREDVTSRAKKLEEIRRVLSPTEVPTGAVQIFPAPIPSDIPPVESVKHVSPMKTTFTTPVEQENIIKKESVEEVFVEKKVSFPGSGDWSIQPIKPPVKTSVSPVETKPWIPPKSFEPFVKPVSPKPTEEEPTKQAPSSGFSSDFTKVVSLTSAPAKVPELVSSPTPEQSSTLAPMISSIPTSVSAPAPAPVPIPSSIPSSIPSFVQQSVIEPVIIKEQKEPLRPISPKPFRPVSPKPSSEGLAMEKQWVPNVPKSELSVHSSFSVERSTEVVRSASPRPSAEGLAMEKLWIPQKPSEPEIIIPRPSPTGPRHFERDVSPKPSVEGLAMDKLWAHKHPDSGLRKVWPPPQSAEEKPVIPWTTKTASEKVWPPYESSTSKKEETVESLRSVNEDIKKLGLTPSKPIVTKSSEEISIKSEVSSTFISQSSSLIVCETTPLPPLMTKPSPPAPLVPKPTPPLISQPPPPPPPKSEAPLHTLPKAEAPLHPLPKSEAPLHPPPKLQAPPSFPVKNEPPAHPIVVSQPPPAVLSQTPPPFVKSETLFPGASPTVISQPLLTTSFVTSETSLSSADQSSAPPASVPHYIAKTSVMHSPSVLESEVLSSEMTMTMMHHSEVKEEKSEVSSKIYQTSTIKEGSPPIVEECNIKPSEGKKLWPPPSKGTVQTKSSSVVQAKSSSFVDTSFKIEQPVPKLIPMALGSEVLASELLLEPGPPPEIGYAAPPLERRQSYVETIEQDLEKDLEKEPSRHLVGAVRTIPPPPQKEKNIHPPLPSKGKSESKIDSKIHVSKKDSKKQKPVIQAKPFERFPDLEPFPFKPESPKSRPVTGPPPPKPSKFIKGEFIGSDYESDWESTHIPVKWRPYESDTEELSYRRVKPPSLIHPRRPKSTEPEPLPPSRFEKPLEIEGPPRPIIDKTLVATKEVKSTVSKKTASAFQTKTAIQTKTLTQTKTDKIKKQQTNEPRKKHSPPLLKPGSPPEFVQAVPLLKASEPLPETVKTETTSPPKVKPDSPKSKMKAPKSDFPESGYMADTDEPRQFKHATHKSTSIKHEESMKTTVEKTTVITEKFSQQSSQSMIQTHSQSGSQTELQVKAQPFSHPQQNVYQHHHQFHQQHVNSQKTFSEKPSPAKSQTVKAHHKYSESKHEKKAISSSGSTKSKKEVLSIAAPKLAPIEVPKEDKEANLLPFPFKPNPPCPAVKRTVGPPPPSPSKFIKGEVRESDYESDYDTRIPAKWKPADSDVDEPSYRPVHPVLAQKTHSTFQQREGRTPTPPTEFDNPPEFGGPPRPKFEPIEKPSQTFKVHDAHKSSVQPQKVFKPKPVTPRTIPPMEVIVATPAVKPKETIVLEPGSPPEMGYAPPPPRTKVKITPFENATQIETSKVMNFAESTQHTHRVVNVQQTTRVIKFGEKEKKVPDPMHHSFVPKTEQEVCKSKCPPPTLPKKFVPGEFRESDYESDFESMRIKPKWTPGNSDTEEPHYRKVRPPQMTRSSSVPAKSPESSFTSRDSSAPFSHTQSMSRESTSSTLVSTSQTTSQQHEAEQKRLHRVEEMRKRFDETSTNERRRASLPAERQIVKKQDIQLQPGEPPEFGFAEGLATKASYVASKHMSEMTDSFKSKAHKFVSDIMTDVNTAKQPEKTILKPVAPPDTSSTKTGDDPQAYREESRVAEYGTKHIDPDTGLIYFKYDFGYEFGIVLPGEGKKHVGGSTQPPQITPKRTDDIEVPVIHEKTTSECDNQTNTIVPRNTSGPTQVPQFRPKKFTHFKSVKWEPASESEMSEVEGDSALHKKRYSLPQPSPSVQREPHIHIPSSSRWEPASPSPLSLSLSPSLPSLSPHTGAILDSTVSPGGSWQGLSPKSPRVGHGRGNTPTPPSTPSTPGSTPGPVPHQLRKPPTFITPLRDIAVVKGQTARFECIVQAEPPPNILWAKDGRLLENSNKHQIHYRNGVCRLTLPQAFPDDAGTYTCTATNMLGTIGTSGSLQVPGERCSLYK